MKKTIMVIVVGFSLITLAGCSGQFWGGGATGAIASAGGYEFHMNQEKKRLQEDLKNGKIKQEEYDIRIDQLHRDSVFQK